ncbi:MAG: tetratricopeptide repeat protein, partial [Anaerolineae bacterium]|nr:tetratricopeptide repeat protein [Anaerolineae bacterium]
RWRNGPTGTKMVWRVGDLVALPMLTGDPGSALDREAWGGAFVRVDVPDIAVSTSGVGLGFLAFAIGSATVAAVLSLFLLLHVLVLRPLAGIGQAARQVSAGHLDVHVSPTGHDDEVDAFIATFNGMITEIGGARREMERRVEEALARSEEAVVLAPDNARVWTAVAAAYLANGDRLLDAGDPNGANLEYAQAVTSAERAIDLNPENPIVLSTAYAYVAGGLVAQGEPELYQDAQIQAETAITLDPENALARYYMGQVFTVQGFYDAAREQFLLGIQAHESSSREHDELAFNVSALYIEMAYNAFSNSRLPEAIIWFEDALQTDPDNADAYDGLAYMYLQLGDDQQAEEQAIRSVELNPNVARAHGRLGEAYMRNNKFDLAIEEFNKATSLYGEPTETNARFFYLLADAYIRAGLQNCPQAIPLLQAVAEKNEFYGELAQPYLLDCRRAVLESNQ